MIIVTEKASKKIAELKIEQNHTPEIFLRVGVDSGGCSGLSYNLSFSKECKASDQT